MWAKNARVKLFLKLCLTAVRGTMDAYLLIVDDEQPLAEDLFQKLHVFNLANILCNCYACSLTAHN